MFSAKIQLIKMIQSKPNDYDLNLQLGMFCVNEKNYSEAKRIFKKLILINKSRYEGYLNLSNIYNISNKLDEAEKILKKFLIKNKYNKEIINGLASLYYNSYNYKKLNFLINQYIDLDENHILFFLKAILFEVDNKIDLQINFLYKSIDTNNNFWPAYEKLFSILERTNKIDEFEKIINLSKEIFKTNIQFFYYLSLCLFRKGEIKKSLAELEIKKVEKEFIKFNNINYLTNLYDLLSKIHLTLKNFNLSLTYAIKRNSLSINYKNNQSSGKKDLLDIITKYKIYYKSFKKSKKNTLEGLPHNNLVFLVGFPRSGTTLLDTILRSHSKTFVLEEKPYLINIRHKFFKKNTLDKINSINENQIIKLQKEYFSSFDFSEKYLVIDKFPLNLIELGFIKQVFPNSKIILALRHPLDVILSCVLTSFKVNEAMANYENLDTSAFFYNEVFSLFNIYKNSLELNYHTIKYENVVINFDNEMKNLLSFLNLEYEDSLKNYYITAKNRQKINTPSYHQVIQPIYSKSIERYKNFPEIKKIKPLIAKWINEFSY